MKATRNKEVLLVANASSDMQDQLNTTLGGVFDLHFAAGDEQLLIRAKQELPSLILLEAFPPYTAQFDLCQRLVKEKSLSMIPVILIVDPEGVKVMAEGFYKGAADYVTKPLIPAELLVRLGGQLELSYSSGVMNQIKHRERSTPKDSPPHPSTTNHFMPGRRRRVLLVDDYLGNLNALSAALEEFYEVSTATNGRDAVALANEERFDIILLDIVMPEMDGFEACRLLKENEATSDIPIIFLTGMMDTQDEVRGFELGGVDYIAKPYSLSVVLARVRNHLLAAQNRELLKSMSYLDGLTNIPNRRHFDDTLEKEYQRAVRDGTPISLLLIDIDHFKAYNDHYGHVAGDDCLCRVSQVLSRCQKRASDFVARYGGEEFVTILPDTDSDGAQHMALTMSAAVRNLNIPHESHRERHVTVSIGAATCLPDSKSEAAELIELADRLLYAAKHAGRNQIKSAIFRTEHSEYHRA